MFIEDEDIEMADNVEEATEPVEEQPAPPAEQVDQTKMFAKRLKEETEKVRLRERENIAQSFGYNSWDEYMSAQTDNKLLDKGLDPESVRPVIKDLIKNDPEYIEAMKYKQEKEELEKELFASNSLQALNNKFGTNYKSVDELDAETIKDWNNGTPLEKAFAANNYTLLVDMAVKKASVTKDNGKSHLKTVTGSNAQTSAREVSKGEHDVARMFGFSEEQLKNYINRTNKK
jgi:hypothetical protein